MARVFTDGAELGDLSFWSYVNNLIYVVSNIKRSGNFAYKIQQPILGSAEAFRNITPIGEGWLRYAYCPEVVPRGATTLKIMTPSGSEIFKIGARGGDAYFDYYINGAYISTGSRTLQANAFQVVEVHVKCGSSDGVAEVKIDGVLDFQYNGNVGGTDTIGRIGFYSENLTYYLDDLALNDATGTEDNAWCGDGRVILLRPDANGDVTQLTASTGSNYACVDEGFPANDDTDYVYSDVTNAYDLYHLENPAIPSDAVIRRIWGVARAKKTVAESGAIQIGIKTGGMEYWSSDIEIGINYGNYSAPAYTKNPSTNAAWTINELNNLQIGVKVR